MPNTINGGAKRVVEATQELHTYRAAVAGGFYGRDTGGLRGKHDNVRRAWEDQVTRFALHEFLGPLVQRKRAALERLRVVDLGCGSGEGYEILTSLRKPGGELATWCEGEALSDAMIGAYFGLDISPAMVEQGRRLHVGNPKVTFDVCDLSQGLGPAAAEPAFDIYFSSFGSLSHLPDEALARLVHGVCAHMGERAVLVADLLGRFSYEWPAYWDGPGVRPYSMSYLQTDATASPIESFPVRYWSAAELDTFLAAALRGTGVCVSRRHLQDRSVLVGRHMDTAELNPHARSIRRAVNRLHEPHLRTDLRELIFDYIPHPDPQHAALNRFFERFQMAWNAVVESAIEALERWDDAELLATPPPEGLPAPVRDAIRTIRDVVRNVKWFRMGDPQANVIEPQLGYVLRNLEVDLQQGLGAAHGLLAFYELSREEAR
jgi:SAM-dependent methyltransferase